MELAKVTSKGQVTIPVEIRRKLGIKVVEELKNVVRREFPKKELAIEKFL